VSGPGHDRTARQVTFLASTRCRPTGPNHNAIDTPQIPVQDAVSIEPALQGLEDAVERTVFSIASEPAIHDLPGAIGLGQVAPGGTAAQPPRHAVEDGPVLLPLAAFASILREQGCNSLPLGTRELMRHISKLLSAGLSSWVELMSVSALWFIC
jgi:hypothetical protein